MKTCDNCKHGPASDCDLECYGNYSVWEPIETGVGNQPLSRAKLAGFMAASAENMKNLFAYKNTDYGADADAFANFRKTAVRVVIPWVKRLCGVEVSEREAMFLVLMVLQDKHLVALSQTGIDGHEVAERLQDVAVYAMIGKAMKENDEK